MVSLTGWGNSGLWKPPKIPASFLALLLSVEKEKGKQILPLWVGAGVEKSHCSHLCLRDKNLESDVTEEAALPMTFGRHTFLACVEGMWHAHWYGRQGAVISLHTWGHLLG